MEEEIGLSAPEGPPKDAVVIASSAHNDGISLEPKWKQRLIFGCFFLVTSAWIIFTIILCFRSSDSSTTIFPTATTTVLILNILSTGSALLLRELVLGAFEILRWTLITRPQGVGVATFLAVSRATSAFGTLRLLFSNQHVGHRKWCAQRFGTCRKS
jgi:hypothetical protein